MVRLLVLLIMLFGCTNSKKSLPKSIGEQSEIIFVVDDIFWDNLVDTVIQRIFCKKIEGVNQEESLFKVVQVNHKEFKSILKTHTNIIIISKGVENCFEKNKWAKGQFVAQLNWPKKKQEFLKEIIKIKNRLVEKEVASVKKKLKKKSNKTAEESIRDNFGVECIVPNEYEVLKNDTSFFWANFNPKKSDEIKNIIIFSFSSSNKNFKQEVLEKTDSVFSKYLKGVREGSFARIEPEYPPYIFQNTYRGLWRLEKGFMGGPFLIKTYSKKRKTVVSIGLVFAPQNSKRRYIKEFEAIL